MSRLGTRVPPVVPLPRSRNVPSQDEKGIQAVGNIIQSAAATGSSLARLSSQQSRRKAGLTKAKFDAEAREFDVETAALKVQEEQLRGEQIKERVLGKKAEAEVDRLIRLEDDGFDALMKEKSPEDLDEFIATYRFLSKSKQNEVESYIGRQIGSGHLVETLAEYHEFASDPGNDPNDFSLVDTLTKKLEEANLTPGAHKAYTDYTLPQIGGIQRGQMANHAAAQKAEIRRNTASQLIEGFGSYLMGEGDPTDAPFLLSDLGHTASELSVDGTDESKHTLMMRAATAAIDSHLKAGTDPTVMLKQLNGLKDSMPGLHRGLREAGAMQLVEQEIINAESRQMKGVLGEIQKRIVIAGSDRGNIMAMSQLRDELADIDTSKMSPEASQGLTARIGTMIFNIDTRVNAIKRTQGEYNRIMLNLGTGDRLGPGESATPEAMDQVAKDIMAQPGAKLPAVAALFVDDGYGMPPYLMGLLKADLDINFGGGNLARAYRTWKAISDADEDFGFAMLNADKITGMNFLRRIVNLTGQVDPDTEKVEEILALVESSAYQRIQTSRPSQTTENDVSMRAADNVYGKTHDAINKTEIRTALDIDGDVPVNVFNFYKDAFAFRSTQLQMNDLNDNASMETLERLTRDKAIEDLQANYHVLRPKGKEGPVVEERFFPGIGVSSVIEQAVNDGIRDVESKLDATTNFSVPVSVGGRRRWWPVVSDDPGHDPTRAGIVAFLEWDTTSNEFQVIERHGNEEVFETAVSRVLRGHSAREMNPIERLQHREGEPNTIGLLDFRSQGSRGMQVLNVIERAWDRQSNDSFDIGIPRHAQFANDFAMTQLRFSGGFGTMMVNEFDPLLEGGLP